MTHQPPLPPGSGPGHHPGPGPHAVHGQGSPGAPPFHGAHPAYAGYPPAAPRFTGFNPWLAGFIGVVIGGVGAMVLSFVVPMLFFGLLVGGGALGESFDGGFVDGPQRVTVEADGSVSGVALAEALEEAWYEDMTCPNTAMVATDTTTICRGNDGFEDVRVVVVFRGGNGEFSTADVFP